MMNRREVNRLMLVVAGAFVLGPTQVFAGNALAKETQAQSTASSHSGDSIAVTDLQAELLPPMEHPELRMLTLTLAPGATSHPHKHTGPVFAYIVEGSVENQVDPEPAKTYNAGDFFYEPAMHVHRELKNLSGTKPAKILVCEVGEKGKPFTLAAMVQK